MEIYFAIDGVKLPTPIEFTPGDDDLSSEDSGRTLDGVMHKNSVTSKEFYNIKFPPLDWVTNASVMNRIRNKNQVMFTYPSPLVPNTLTTKPFYIQGRSLATMIMLDRKVMWKDLAFQLAEI